VFAGNFKKRAISPDSMYVARNARFKASNVILYKDVKRGDYIVLDFPHRRLYYNDFLRKTGTRLVRFLHSTLPVDDYYFSEFEKWVSRLEEFYAAASLC
jgi:hypothetical protein